MKTSLLLFLFSIGILIFVRVSYAADLNIKCSETKCSPETIEDFFPETEIWYPTKTYTKRITISNNSELPSRVSAIAHDFIQAKEGADLSKVIQYTIIRESDNEELWTGSLYSFYHSGEVTLIDILAIDRSATFLFKGEMYSTAGNEYQNTNTQFNLIFTISNNIPITPQPPCTVRASAIPGSVNLIQGVGNEILVSWGQVDGVSGYEVSWGTNNDADNKGLKSVGITSETKIYGFDLKASKYFFKIRSVNECARSDWTLVRSSDGILLLDKPTVAPGLAQRTPSLIPQGVVAGAQTNFLISTTPPLVSSIGMGGNVKSIKKPTSIKDKNIWWIILLGECIGLSIYVGLYKYINRKIIKKVKKRYIKT